MSDVFCLKNIWILSVTITITRYSTASSVANQTLPSALRVLPSGCVVLFHALLFSLQLGKHDTVSHTGKGAPIPWTDFDFIWHSVPHNYHKTIIKLSSFYRHFLMSYGCHWRTDRHTHTHTWFYETDYQLQLWYFLMVGLELGLIYD